jgi:hypothetical protein
MPTNSTPLRSVSRPALVALIVGFTSISLGESAPDGDGSVTISGELRQWHKITLTLAGPFARETNTAPNPFTDYRMTVHFRHQSGTPEYAVPGYFAADGNAAESSSETGTQWRAHLSPDRPGRWDYRIAFVAGPHIALSSAPGTPLAPFDGQHGHFDLKPTNKTGRDLRGEGRLQYVGKHHLRFAGSRRFFLKAGADSPESLLAYADFDNTRELRPSDTAPRVGEAAPKGLHRYAAHAADWRPGDPTWKDGRGKGLIGALNYLAGKGCNAFSFLPYNVGGDGDNVWPFVEPDDKFHYDCSKLDQWGVVFDHAQQLGLYLHFKLQETEIDDNRHGNRDRLVPSALDGGDLGPERRLYLRELIARFGHALALNWNLGEENTQSPEQQRAMAHFIQETDPYHHLRVVHTYPDWQDRVYPQLLGDRSALTGASLQNYWDVAHQRTLKWLAASAYARKPWVVANDEQGDASLGVPPDPGYAEFNGNATEKSGRTYTLHDIRKRTLWGNLMAGGAGVEYYFGYTFPQNDLVCEDWRSRDQSWDYCRIALDFFREHDIPFWDMTTANARIGNDQNDHRAYCLAQPGEIFVVYLPDGGSAQLDLGPNPRRYRVRWFNPRSGGPLVAGSVSKVRGPGRVALGEAPRDPDQDWAIVVRAE